MNIKMLTFLVITTSLSTHASLGPISPQEYLEYYNLLVIKQSSSPLIKKKPADQSDLKKVLGIEEEKESRETVIAQMLAELHQIPHIQKAKDPEEDLRSRIEIQKNKISSLKTSHNSLAEVYPGAHLLSQYTQQEREATTELFRLEKQLFELLKVKLYDRAHGSLKIVNDKNQKFLLYPLHEAVRLCMYDCVIGLLHTPINPDAMNHVGKKPVHIAVEKIENEQSAIAIIKKLIESGVDVNSQSRLGDNALYYALSLRKYQLADVLIEKGSTDNQGPMGSVLPFLITCPDQTVAKSFFISLIARGANPNAKLADGNNLLYGAITHNQVELAKAILTCGGVDNDGPAGSVEEDIKRFNDLELTNTFAIRKNCVPTYLESWDNYSPRNL
ncbi:hypothetical protein Noda2021_10900 [Candidatus Dependentiae bacterium Noda2021]|nr:hypothetical protein Noda2021_10900 [Candidatus Dependentiae bacterium Noda2021]